ncbi:lipase isoform X6 [Camellia sinensis]|uniref:lipase isoform X6 n=1 Tax=Camellia sinensis TaxID=4442 RepID=UPI001035B066|nr:lipase isoform X6 [Camellia sinensis]
MYVCMYNMEQRRWLKIAILMCLLAMSCSRELKVKHKDNLPVYNHTIATILVEYASAVYLSDLTELFTWTCSRCDDLTEGFEVIELIVDVEHCLQGFVGVAKDLNAIVIAFRGTQENSIQNWVEDLYWKQLDLNYPSMPDAMVHHGFYSAYHNTTIRPGVVNAVKRAKKLYGDINVMVTGHSMGGAMAAFCALDLKVWLYNAGFGSLVYPVEKVCDDSGEDPSCSRSVMGNSISDHLEYYGVELGGDTPRTCRIVMDPRVAEYGVQDLGGNFILSRDPSTSVVKLKIESSIPSNVI